jgi:hypothetical protein
VVLEEPVLALRGDRFVLRDETARVTLGGGVVVESVRDRHRRDEPSLVERLTALRDGDLANGRAHAAGDGARASLATVRGGRSRPSASTSAAAVARPLAGAPGCRSDPRHGARPEAWTTAEKWDRYAAALLALVAAQRMPPSRPSPASEMEHARAQQLGAGASAEDVPRWAVERLVAAGAPSRATTA